MRATHVERSKSEKKKGDGASDVAKGVSALTLEAKPAPRKPMDEVSKSKLFRISNFVKPLHSHSSYMLCSSIIILQYGSQNNILYVL